MKKWWRLLARAAGILVFVALNFGYACAEEFIGPFASWTNLKSAYQAVGDGRSDDTAALQQALDEVGQSKHSPVLYIPAGIYRITRQLNLSARINISVIGEDPATTKILWNGPRDGIMLQINGVAYSRFDRVTWDGTSSAQVAIDEAWDGKTGYAATHNQYAGHVFQDVGYGIRGGNGGFQDAEIAILRCRFLRNSLAGVNVRNFNALDWFIWYSSFENCAVGVTNEPGAGNFHVYYNNFRNSSVADVVIRQTSYFSLRNNLSVGSKAFFLAYPVGQNGAQVTLQSNTIVGALDREPIRIQNYGPVLMLDNVINGANGAQGPVSVIADATADLVSIGNTFTQNTSIQTKGRWTSIDDRVISGSTMIPVVTPSVAAAPNLHRKVFDVPVGADAATIQRTIDLASRATGGPQVVHLPAGEYHIAQTLVIAAGTSIILAGDGYGTSLLWTGSTAGPVVRLGGPSKAILRDLAISGGGIASGIRVENSDQPAARVFMEQGLLLGAQRSNLLVNGLDNANVELHDFGHGGCSAGVSVSAIGGPSSARGTVSGGRTVIFGGSSDHNNLSYDVTNGGKLIVQDIWYETQVQSQPSLVHLSGAGSFTLNGAMIHTASTLDTPAVEISDFQGKVAILTTNLDDRIVVDGIGSNTRVLALCDSSQKDPYFFNSSPNARVALLDSRHYVHGTGTLLDANQGISDPAFIRDLLSDTRSQKPTRPSSSPGDGITDVQFYRVMVQKCLTGIEVSPTSGSS